MPHPERALPKRPRLPRFGRALGLGLVLTLLLAAPALAGPREQARRMHDRIVGVPPTAAVLDAMQVSITDGDPLAAAYTAMQSPIFYTSALKHFVTPWTNEEGTAFADLNDYTATVIGLIRDDRPFTEVLFEDLVYVAAPGLVDASYSHTNNEHYREIEARDLDLSDPTVLVAMPQSALPGAVLRPEETAGVITTRAAGEAFFSAGTNRRMWRFLGMNYLCRDMEELHDVTRPAHRVRQDVTRSPGGDSRIYHSNCVGCHNGMDALAGAFAYFEWDAELARVVYTRGSVQQKNLINAVTFQGGWVTESDHWENLWRSGPNANLGWRGPAASGNGAKSLGREVADSRAFSLCQVEKVMTRVCLHPPQTPADFDEVRRVADVFEAEGRSLRRVFAEAATYCMGE